MGTSENGKSGGRALMASGPTLAFAAGDTFLILGPASGKLHLYIALCDQQGDPPTFIAVPLNTTRFLSDTTVLLQSGDHPFINRETSVSYDLLHQFYVDQLLQLEGMGPASGQLLFEMRQRMRPDILQRLVAGALQSDLAPKKLVRMLGAMLGGVNESQP